MTYLPVSCSLQYMLSRSMLLIEVQFVSTSLGSPTMMASDCALDTATFNLFLSSKNSIPREPNSPGLAHMEMITIGASCPWNLSTDATLAPSGSKWASLRTCRL